MAQADRNTVAMTKHENRNMAEIFFLLGLVLGNVKDHTLQMGSG
jgi:hypothetical protein